MADFFYPKIVQLYNGNAKLLYETKNQRNIRL